MRFFQIVVIVLSIQIGRQNGDKVATVLRMVGLTHFDTRYFSYSVGFIGAFQNTGQQCIFAHWLSSIAWINTRRTQKQKFFYTIHIALMNDMILYHQILVNKLSTIGIICNNTTYFGSSKHHKFRFLCCKKSRNCLLAE